MSSSLPIAVAPGTTSNTVRAVAAVVMGSTNKEQGLHEQDEIGNAEHQNYNVTGTIDLDKNGNSGSTMVSSGAMSTSALEGKLRQLREQSNRVSQVLTQKLASSQSGQDLLHIGTSLSTLPPDLHSLLATLHPVLSAAEKTEKEQILSIQKMAQQVSEIRSLLRRMDQAHQCADLLLDLVAAERAVQQASQSSTNVKIATHGTSDRSNNVEHESIKDGADYSCSTDEIDRVSALERAATIVLCLIEDLQTANETISSLTTGTMTKKLPSTDESPFPSLWAPLEEDTEKAQFLMKLAPRIRRLESDTTLRLSHRTESILKQIQQHRDRTTTSDQTSSGSTSAILDDLLLMLGHCMRGLALLGRGADVESLFARVAIMPLIRTRVSMGRLDEGGPRGECHGLASLLHEMTISIAHTFGPVLCLAESMFQVGDAMDVDLLTNGVWVPISTALMADAGIRMAMFSPGIASILQANYTILDTFLADLARNLLQEDHHTSAAPAVGSESNNNNNLMTSLLYNERSLSNDRVREAQARIYAHTKTAEFSKKWNLPIYYQLRFGECCRRINVAVDKTRREGWIAEDVFSGSSQIVDGLKHSLGFELGLFLELYDVLLSLWKPDVILRPLTNRFLRGAVQLVGRVVAFITDSMGGTIKFGEEIKTLNSVSYDENGNVADGGSNSTASKVASVEPKYPTRAPYCWGESEQDVAAVAWELTLLDSALKLQYVETVCKSLAQRDTSASDLEELTSIVHALLKEACDQIDPVVERAWNDKIVSILTFKCSGSLAAVKGVAATYRMTNRPPPTQSSPYVPTILRPLKEFDRDFSHRTPDRIGPRWKHQVVSTIADRYAAAVDELLATVQRTEAALQNRRTRRVAAGGTTMSDGEKVKLQVFLDYKTFALSVLEVGIDPSTILGLSKLSDLTAEGESLQMQTTNGNSS